MLSLVVVCRMARRHAQELVEPVRIRSYDCFLTHSEPGIRFGFHLYDFISRLMISGSRYLT